MRINIVAAVCGAMFGFGFASAGFNQYDIVHRTLLLQYWDSWLVFASAVGTALPIIWLLERAGWHTPLGGKLTPRRWPVGRNHILGGAVFGAGWAVTGACPGTVSTMVVAGGLMGLIPLAGIMIGILLRDRVAERGSTTAVAEEREPVPAGIS